MPSADPSPSTVVVCEGKDCLDRAGAARKLRRDLRNAGIEPVFAPCLGVCRGPVAVVVPTVGRPVALERLRGSATRAVLVDAVGRGGVTAELRAHEVSSSKRRAKAIRRATRALRR